MAVIQIKRGPQASMPLLAVGELAFATDTRRMFVGSAAGNVLVSGVTADVGLAADLPTLTLGQMYFAFDTAVMWIGTSGGNVAAAGGGGLSAAAVQTLIFANT